MIARDPAAGNGFERPFRWYHKMAAILVAIFCFEVGVFLVIFPWMDYWSGNYFASFSPGWHEVWQSNYFRGALSGLGLVNIYIALVQVFRLRRFSGTD